LVHDPTRRHSTATQSCCGAASDAPRATLFGIRNQHRHSRAKRTHDNSTKVEIIPDRFDLSIDILGNVED
jgi:hypothetical protein